MNPLLRVAAVLLLAVVVACGTDSAPDGSPSASGEASARSGSPAEALAEACLASTNWNRAQCACAGRLADDELSDRARDFAIATLREDRAAMDQLRQGMTIEEATQSGLFMVRAGRECGGVRE